MVAALEIKSIFKKMADESKSIFSNNTMIPVSLVTAFVAMTVSVVIAFTSIRKDVDHSVNAITNMADRINQLEKDYIKKDEMLLRMQIIQTDIADIKEQIKGK
jgi:predicted PurR-regulated permease PerM